MTTEDSRAVIHRWVDAVNSGDIDAAVQNLAEDFVGHFSAMPMPVEGREGFKMMYMGFIKPAFPDQHITVEMDVASGDKIAAQTRWTATHTGDFVGIPPTGRTVDVPGTAIFRIEGDKIAEEWIQEDFLGIYQQLTAEGGQ
jgi:steroid delta-isomerase-like uncharacterized protein